MRGCIVLNLFIGRYSTVAALLLLFQKVSHGILLSQSVLLLCSLQIVVFLHVARCRTTGEACPETTLFT